MKSRVALVTCRALPEGDPDDRALPAVLAARGLDARWAVWDDPTVDWGAFSLVLVRSPWDYPERRDAFLAWAGSVPSLANRAEVLDWNTDKRYLADLAQAGLPVIPTAFVAPGEPVDGLVFEGELVVKPAVSAGGRGAGRFADPAAARDHIAALHANGAIAMVQPYVPSVDDEGETGLVYLGGAFSHAFGKAPMLTEQGVVAPETITARDADAAQRATADWVLLYVRERFGPLTYARIDLVAGPDGTPLLLEAELTEPSLYLWLAAGASDRLARAVAAQIG